jgi:hypothetical protein
MPVHLRARSGGVLALDPKSEQGITNVYMGIITGPRILNSAEKTAPKKPTRSKQALSTS